METNKLFKVIKNFVRKIIIENRHIDVSSEIGKENRKVDEMIDYCYYWNWEKYKSF